MLNLCAHHLCASAFCNLIMQATKRFCCGCYQTGSAKYITVKQRGKKQIDLDQPVDAARLDTLELDIFKLLHVQFGFIWWIYIIRTTSIVSEAGDAVDLYKSRLVCAAKVETAKKKKKKIRCLL